MKRVRSKNIPRGIENDLVFMTKKLCCRFRTNDTKANLEDKAKNTLKVLWHT